MNRGVRSSESVTCLCSHGRGRERTPPASWGSGSVPIHKGCQANPPGNPCVHSLGSGAHHPSRQTSPCGRRRWRNLLMEVKVVLRDETEKESSFIYLSVFILSYHYYTFFWSVPMPVSPFTIPKSYLDSWGSVCILLIWSVCAERQPTIRVSWSASYLQLLPPKLYNLSMLYVDVCIGAWHLFMRDRRTNLYIHWLNFIGWTCMHVQMGEIIAHTNTLRK